MQARNWQQCDLIADEHKALVEIINQLEQENAKLKDMLDDAMSILRELNNDFDSMEHSYVGKDSDYHKRIKAVLKWGGVMKTEITIDGITYRVGDVLELDKGKDKFNQKIVYIGHDLVVTEYKNERGILKNSMILHSNIKHFKIKKHKKIITVRRWLNVYITGRANTYKSKEEADKYDSYRIACEPLEFMYEVDCNSESI